MDISLMINNSIVKFIFELLMVEFNDGVSDVVLFIGFFIVFVIIFLVFIGMIVGVGLFGDL